MENRLYTIKENNSYYSSKKSLTSYLIPSNNKEFLTQHQKTDLDLDLINTQKDIIKDNDPSKIFFIIISSIFISISIYFPKHIYLLYLENFDSNIFLLVHSLSIIITIPTITYYYEKTNILSIVNYLEHKRWFFLRSNLNYIGMIFYIFSLRFFRCITIQTTIISLIPVIFLIGVFFWDRGIISQNLIFGIFCIITGDSLVLYNELKYVNNNGIYYNTIGLIFVFISFTSFSSIKIINRKYVNLDNYNLIVHMLYNNILICIYSLIFMPISYLRGINITINFIFLSILSGVFFVIGVFAMVLVLKKKQSDEENTNIIIPCKPKLEIKILLIYNFNIFYVFLLCFCFCSEEIYFKDIVAAIIIFLFKVFNEEKEFKDIPCFFN